MARYLFLNFNLFNDSLEKSFRKREYSFCLELIIDGNSQMLTFDEYHCTKKIKLPVDRGTIDCILHYRDYSQEYHYIPRSQVFDAREGDVVFTFNWYYVRYDERDVSGIDFGLGEIPPRLKKSGGCYVATCVYGSYDCPQVWTLRRYRDYTLAKTWYGRLFIRTYYAISPTLVKWFGNTRWFKNIFEPKLNKLVRKLNNEGIEDTPYNDKNW